MDNTDFRETPTQNTSGGGQGGMGGRYYGHGASTSSEPKRWRNYQSDSYGNRGSNIPLVPGPGGQMVPIGQGTPYSIPGTPDWDSSEEMALRQGSNIIKDGYNYFMRDGALHMRRLSSPNDQYVGGAGRAPSVGDGPGEPYYIPGIPDWGTSVGRKMSTGNSTQEYADRMPSEQKQSVSNTMNRRRR